MAPPDDDFKGDRDDRYDDRDDAPPYPGTVRVAGAIWILFGCFGLLNAALAVVLAANPGPAGPGGGPNPGGSCCPGLIAVAFLVCGYQTVRGTAADTRGNSVGSIVLAGLQLAVGVGLALLGLGAFGPGAGGAGLGPQEAVIVGAVVCGLGMGLLTAGVLGLVGRKQYLAWRAYHYPKRKRRRTDEEDDDRR